MTPLRAAHALPAVAVLLVACGGAATPAPSPAASPTAPPTVVTPLPADVSLEGERFVAVRTLPPPALSAEKLEAAGTATAADGTRVSLARADSPDVAAWELVSAAPDGWRVWRPGAVTETLAAAGAGATLVSVTPMEWPDACMGLAAPGEVCAEVITPGYVVVVEQAGRRTEYHVSKISGVRRTAP